MRDYIKERAENAQICAKKFYGILACIIYNYIIYNYGNGIKLITCTIILTLQIYLLFKYNFDNFQKTLIKFFIKI